MASTPTDRQSPSTDTQHAAATAHLPHYFHPPRSASTSSGEPTPKASSSTSHVQWRSESSVPTTASSNSTWRTQAPILPESIPLPIKDQVPPSPSTAPSASTSSISISESSATSASSDSKSPTVHTSTCLPSAAPIHSAPDALPPSAASQDFSAQVPGHAHTSSAAPVVTDRSPAPLQFGDHSLPYSPTLFDLKHALSLDKSSKQQDFRQSLQLHTHLMGLSLSTRLLRGLDSAHEQAHEAFKNRQRQDQRHAFVSVFNQAYDEAERTLHRAFGSPQPRPSFLDRMTQGSSKAILDFVHCLRTEPKVLARAFANLQSQELDHLTIPERPVSTIQSAATATGGSMASMTSLPSSKVGQATLSRGFSGASTKPPSARERSNSLFMQGSLGSQSSVFGSSTKHSHGSPVSTQSRSQSSAQGASTTLGQGSDSTIPNFMNNHDVVHIILENLFGPSSFESETRLRRDLVATIIAELLAERKGDNRLIGEFLERYLTLADWQHSSRAKAKFEVMILDILQRGDKALDGYSDQELNAEMSTSTLPATKASLAFAAPHHAGHGDSAAGTGRTDDSISRKIGEPLGRKENLPPMLPRLTTRQSKVEEFFTEACLEILECLREHFPPSLLQLIHAIFERVDDDKHGYATLVIITKFVFYRFMNKCIAYPETYGLVQDNFITERQRQRTLFTTHQRLYRSVTMILNPLPGWERRAAWIDPRLREAVEDFVAILTTPKATQATQEPLNLTPGASFVSPALPRLPSSPMDDEGPDIKSQPTITPVLMLCPSDVTTLFFFVAPKLRTPVAAQASQSPGSSAVTRSNSFGGGRPQRHRTTSETPPLATRAAVNAASVNHPTEVPQTSRVHKRSSASFSFFGGASFKSKPPPPTTTLEKTKGSNATADANGGTSSTFTSSSASTGHYLAGPSPTLSAVRTGSTVQPQMATIEVTTTTRIGIHPETGIATCPTTRATVVQTSSPQESSILRSMEGLTQEEPVRSASPTPIAAPPEDWANEELLRAMKTALQELKTMYPGPIKEAPWSLYKASFDALQEPWALVYVQYPSSSRKRQSIRSGVHGSLTADQILTPVGLTMAPPCMAMVMENSALGARPRNVTVTTPVLVDQGMDSAGNPEGGLSEGLVVDLDLDVDVSDTDSILMPEDASSHSMTSSASFGVTVRLTHDDHHGHMDWSGTRSSRTHGQDIFRTDSSHTLSSLGNGTSSSLHPPLSSSSSSSYPRAPASNGSTRRHRDASPMTPQRSKEMDLLWRQRMQQRVRSEFDLPEDIRTVAKAVFRVLREFDVVMPMNVAWFDPGRASWKDGEDGRGGRMSIRSLLLRAMDQARLYGSHAAAISIHHALSILEASPILQALDDSKLVFLLALPIYHRLQHRSERMRARILWESYAHGWHQRVLSAIERRREDLSSLRIKMYYQTCVRPSRAFERSSAVVQVLSRLNHEILQKYMTAEELECERQRLVDLHSQNSSYVWIGQCGEPENDESLEAHDDAADRYGASRDAHNHNSMDIPAGEGVTPRRRDSPTKSRRSSFSTYIDNMTARSYNSQVSFLESQMREKDRERDRELEKTKKLSSSYTPSQHGSHLLNQYYHVQEPQGTSRHQPLNRAGSRHSLGSHAAGSGPRGWPTMFDKDTSSSLSSTLGTSSPPTVPPVTDFVMDAREASAAKKWIQDTGINDFMPGEDNFHRFCMEVELVVRGIGLGGTGIQDAGIPQATQGQPSASLHSSGSDFFVKEVTRFNGSFVPGMGPAPELLASAGGGLGSSSSLSTMSSAPSTPTVSTFASAKSSAAVGVAEYLVNSFKGSSSQGTPQAGGGISGVSTLLQGAGGAGSSLSSAANSTKSRLRIRKVAPTLHLASDDRPTSQVDGNHPLLGETDDSIFAAPNPGPTYLLYNPPFASATAGPSSSYSSSATPGNMSLVSLPHQMGQPIKDLDDLLLKIQLKLTSFVLSEWLDLFGGVETDRWFAEFMEDMMLSKGQTESESVDGCDHLPPSSASSVSSSASSSRGVAAASSSQQQPLLTPLLQSTLSMSTGVSATASSAGSTSRGGRGGVRGPSLIVGTHADETAGLSSSLGTMSRTSSSLSNVSAEGCFTMSDVDATYHGSGSSGRSSGAYGDMHDTLVASGGASRFSSTLDSKSSAEPNASANDLTPRPSHADMTPTANLPMHFESGSSQAWDTTVPPQQQQQRPHHSSQSKSIGNSHSTEHESERLGAYDIDEAFRTTIAQMEQVKSPYQKLVHLFSLELLVVASLSYPSSCVGGAGTRSASQSKLSKSIFESMHSISGITSEDEVDDDGREHQQKSARQKRHHRPVPKSYTPGTDAIVNAIEKLFRMPSPFRPQNLFRDMQLIATFVPGSILDLRDDGKAFWDMALAVTSLKQEVVKHLVKRGLELVETEEMAAERPGNSSGSGRGGTGYGYARNDEEERLRMREAVRLFTIGASESSPVAQRELAILYMSLPAIPSNAPRSARYTRAPGGRPQYHLQQQRTQHPHQYQHGQSPAKSASPSGASTFRFMRTGSGGGVGGGSSSTPSSPQSLSTPTMAQGAAALSLSSSVPIKHSGGGGSGRYLQHRHSGSGSGGIGGTASSFTGNVLSGLGIMAGLGSFASGSGGGGRDSSASVETSGGLSSAGSHVGSTTGSFDSSSAVGAADPASTHGAEDHDHLHPSSATYSAMRPCTCGSDLSSYGRHFIGQAAEGQGSHPGRAGDGRSSGLCPHHHNHHRHTSSNSSSSSTGSYERDRSSHGRHSQQHYHEPPGSSSSTRSPGLEKFNPENVAAAMHWFTLAAAHGDKFSIEYLKHRDLTNGMHE